MTAVNVDTKLAMNKFTIDPDTPHIVVISNPDLQELKKLLIACPANLYKQNSDGTLSFDYAGCLECGTCRILCGKTILEKWQYPAGSLGIEHRYG